MIRRPLAIAIAGLLVAPVAMANCDSELDRVEQRVENAGMAPENEEQLIEWLDEQRGTFAGATEEQCATLAAQIEHQMVERGYFASASDTQQSQQYRTTTAAQQSERQTDAQLRSTSAAQDEQGDAERGRILVDAPAADVDVEQPPAQVDVQQQPANVQVEMQQPHVMVRVPDPRVEITQPSPEVTVRQDDPKVSVQQEDPIVSVNQPDPNVTVQQADPTVEVEQGEPDVQVHDSPAMVNVDSSEPEVDVRQSDAANVQVRDSEQDAQQSDRYAAESAAWDDQAQDDTQRAADTERDWQQDSALSGSAATQTASTRDERDEQRTGYMATASDTDLERDRAGLAGGGLGGDSMSAQQLVGQDVVDRNGQHLGSVSEVLKEQEGDQVFVRIDVDSSAGMDADEVLVETSNLERNGNQLRVNGDQEAIVDAANLIEDAYVSADGDMVELGGE